MKEEKTKELTIQQTKFLEVLFNEAGGDYRKAKDLAGYSSETPLSSVTKNLKEDILKYMQEFVLINGPKALFTLIRQLDVDQPNANKLKTIDMILNRMGMGEKKEADIKLDIPEGGIFILPAKEAQVFERIAKANETKEIQEPTSEAKED